MINVKNKRMIGVLISMVALFYIDAIITGPLQNTKKIDNITTVEANI